MSRQKVRGSKVQNMTERRIVKKPKKKTKKVNYVDNKQFYAAIVEHRQKRQKAQLEGKPEPRIPDYIGDCIMKISTNMSTMPSYVHYSFREEMISDAVENSIMYFNNFDPEKSKNPFGYFSQISNYAFIRRIAREKAIRYGIYKNFQQMVSSNGDMALLTDENGKNLMPSKNYDNINNFIEEYERKEAEKKADRKEKKKTRKTSLFENQE